MVEIVKYDKEVMLYFMCGSQDSWEEQFKKVRPNISFNWLGPHIANVTSNTPLVGLIDEVYEKLYKPYDDILPCIEYCRVEFQRGITTEWDVKDPK